VCWSRAVGAVGADLLNFVHCAGTYVSYGRYRLLLVLSFLTNEKDEKEFDAGSFLGDFLCAHSGRVSVL
jgi:hypothetical protein